MAIKAFYSTLRCGALVCALAFGSAATQAAILNLEIIAGMDPETRSTIATFDRDDLGCSGEASDVTSNCSGSDASLNWGGGTFDIDAWNMNIDSDPFINGTASVTNNTGSTQWYTMIFTIPIAPAIGPTSLVGGSIGVTVTDNGTGSGATLSAPAGMSIYRALVDGSTVVDTLFDDPFSLSTGAFGSNSDNTSFGDPIPSDLGPAVSSTIGIRIDFMLTAGDSASFTSVFVVEPNVIPVPAAAWLFGSALLGLGVLRRKR